VRTSRRPSSGRRAGARLELRRPGVLTHSLTPGPAETIFLLLAIIMNRAIIFLRKPAGLLSDSPLAADDQRPACVGTSKT
jgi:hypothetical protein